MFRFSKQLLHAAYRRIDGLGRSQSYLIALGKKFYNNPKKYLLETGFYFQGGIVGAVLWSVLYASVTNIPLSFIWDGLCFGTLLGQFFGRIGCFNYGCCYGKPTTSRWGVTYSNGTFDDCCLDHMPVYRFH